MQTYQQHQRMASLLRELAETIEEQSRELTETASAETSSGRVPAGSPLRSTWPHLGTAFDLLVAHAQSVDDELTRMRARTLVPAL